MIQSLGRLVQQLEKCELELGKGDQSCHAVSHWSVFQQLEHILRVNTQVLIKLTSEVTEAKEKPLKLMGRLLLLSGYIPRGKAKAPQHVLPQRWSDSEINDAIKTANQILEEIRLGERQFSSAGFHHNLLGYLNREQWIKFLTVHTNHHLKIIRDIRHRIA